MSKYTRALTQAGLNDLKDIAIKTINSLVEVADKHNVDRDDFISYFAFVFTVVSETGLYKKYEAKADRGQQEAF